MTYYGNSRQRAFVDKQTEITRMVTEYGRLTPALLARQDQVAAATARHDLLQRGGPPPSLPPGLFRRWVGLGLLKVGMRLAGGEAASQTGQMTSPISPSSH